MTLPLVIGTGLIGKSALNVSTKKLKTQKPLKVSYLKEKFT